MTAHVTAADRLRQVLASAILLTATLGVPTALSLLVGWPLPTAAIDRLPAVLGQPVSSSAVVDVLAVVAWLAWLHFSTATLVELVNATARRGRPRLRLPLGGPSQDLARSLVIAALLVGATAPFPPAAVAPAAGSTSTSAPATSSTAPITAAAATTTRSRGAPEADQPPASSYAAVSAAAGGVTAGPVARATSAMADQRTAPAEDSSGRAVRAVPVYVVSAPAAGQYDCLWDIAEQQLGDGTRWTEIYDLNIGRTQPDGQTLSDPDLIRPGWRLQLPPDARLTPGGAPSDQSVAGGHVVVPGDTLWDIAEDELGDGARYGELAAAAASITQSDGQTLQDPHLIRPGWTIPIPGADTTTDDVPTRASHPAPDQERDASPAQPEAPAAPARDADQPPHVAEAPHVDDRAVDDRAVGDRAPAGEEEQATPTADANDRADADDRADVSNSQAAVDAAVGAAAGATAGEETMTEEGDAGSPVWALAGLTGAGSMLAGALLLLLRQRRRAQSRLRRPGRALLVPPPRHVVAEKSIRVQAATAATVKWLDQLLRRLAAARAATGEPLPAIVAVSLDRAGVTLHLAHPSQLTGPWTATPDRLHWHLPRDNDLDQVGPQVTDQPSPVPLLVTVGAATNGSAPETAVDGAIWLLNLEYCGAVRVTGDRQRAEDLVRYVAAELGCNPWSDGVRAHCVGVADELAPLNPDRLLVTGSDSQHPDGADNTDAVAGSFEEGGPVDPVAGLVADAVATVDRSVALGVDVPDARIQQAADETWPPRVLLIDASPRTPALDALTTLISDHPSRTGTAALVLEADPGPTAHEAHGATLHLSRTGQLSVAGIAGGVPAVLTATGLSREEAHGCAALYALGAAADAAMPIPSDVTDGWRAYTDEAGALRTGLTLPRTHTHVAHGDRGEGGPDLAKEPDRPGGNHQADLDRDAGQETGLDWWHEGPHEQFHDEGDELTGESEDGEGDGDEECVEEQVLGAASVLAAPDEDYLDVAATTREDLSALAPRVPEHVARRVAEVDPGLDDDVAAWFSDACALPRLTLLGPVGARTRGVPVTKRKPYYTELLTYLATRPLGATPEEVAAAFDITPTKARGYVGTVREWLGTSPRTGEPHVPDARRSAAAEDRGVGVYQVQDLLIDVDLFRRLRLRGETRGPDGITDLRRALTLVTGPPFSRLRPGGWAWLADGDRIDQHMLCAVVDVAHLVTTHLLHAGDLNAARATAELAALAAPDEEIPRLDLAAVAAASGHHSAAAEIVRGEICNRTDDAGPPDELSPRTQQILDRHGWLTGPSKAAS